MKRFLGIALLLFVAVAGWRIGELLSTDALGMALGVIFGMMAGIPAALIALSAGRLQQPIPTPQTAEHYQSLTNPQPMQHYPPVIVIAGGQQGQHQLPLQGQGYPMQPPRLERRFKMVGEGEGWIGE